MTDRTDPAIPPAIRSAFRAAATADVVDELCKLADARWQRVIDAEAERDRLLADQQQLQDERDTANARIAEIQRAVDLAVQQLRTVHDQRQTAYSMATLDGGRSVRGAVHRAVHHPVAAVSDTGKDDGRG